MVSRTRFAEYNSMDSALTALTRNGAGVVAKWDFALRSDYKALLSKSKRGNDEDRPYDVAHLWDVTNQRYGYFRDRVTQQVSNMIGHFNLTGVAGLVSKRGKVGRTSTSDAYANALLDHKIIVVAQRDEWEDHLRLFESLAGGGMVLHDPMTHPPAGLLDGVNIVFYSSLEDMSKKILYYLRDPDGIKARVQIAKAGQELCLEHHQNGHRIERLLLGDNWPTDWRNPVAPLLRCDEG